MNLGCVVLAAGRSSRFGENKLLNPLKGRAVLARVLDSLPRERFERIAVVAASEGVEQLCRERQLQCLRYSGGTQSESIRLGIRAMTGLEGCLFVMGDQPLCARASMERLLGEEIVETTQGEMKVMGVFRITKTELIAGGQMLKGKLTPKLLVRVKHGSEILGEAEVESVQKERIEVKELIENEIGGLAMKTDKRLPLEVGDRLEFFTRERHQRKLGA